MDHTVRLQINCGGDTVGWHFSRYDGPKEWKVIVDEIPIGFKFGSNFTKIRHMDDTSRRMQRGDKVDETFQVQGPGTFILDFSDWSNDCDVEAAITVDGEPRFSTSSYGIDRRDNRSLNLANWNSTFGHDVRQTDDREIAFPLN